MSIEDCRRMVRNCDCAIMAAAVTGGAQMAKSSPWKQVSDNVVMDVQLLHALWCERVSRVVYVSSATVYQDFGGSIREDELDMNQDPHSAYLGVGWAKRYIEKLCRFWHEKAALEVIIARTSNIYGEYDKFDPSASHFVPALIRKAAERADPFEIWGSPNVIRDIIYGEDFARAIALMMDNDELKFDIFNLGSGLRTSVGDVAELVLKYADYLPERILYQNDRPSTISVRALDCSRINEKIGWKPMYSQEEGIQKTMKWWLENKGWWKK